MTHTLLCSLPVADNVNNTYKFKLLVNYYFFSINSQHVSTSTYVIFYYLSVPLIALIALEQSDTLPPPILKIELIS